MDDTSPTGNEFPSNAPIRYTITLIHLLVMSPCLFGLYATAVIQQSSKTYQKQRLILYGLAWLLCLVGFNTGLFIPYPSSTPTAIHTLHKLVCLVILILISIDFGLEKHKSNQECENDRSMTRQVLQWITLYCSFLYLAFSLVIFTSSCHSVGQCWLPLATGTGFVFYGSLAFMHLLGLFSLPRSPETYEAVCLLLCGLVSFIWWDSPIVGSSWKVINLSLLWSTGSLWSLAVSFQDWVPFLQKRNIVNSIILCLTGKGILSGQSADNSYATQLQSMLGYIIMIGSVTRLIQIMYRQSPTDNIPRLYSRASGANCDETMDMDDLGSGQRRANDYEMTYRQLTGLDSTTKCKHQSVYASITLVCGLLSCFMAIAAGLILIGTIDNWVESMRYYISDPTIYVNVLLAMAFLWTVYLVIMCTLYKYFTKQNGKYEYIDLATNDYCDPPASTKSSPGTTYNDTVTTPTSSTSTMHDFASVPIVPPSSKTTDSSTSPPLMRPSQYRAKRRSLLISTSINQDSSKRGPRTSSHSGVGGVLPDTVPLYMEDPQALYDVWIRQDEVHRTDNGMRKDRQWMKSKRRRATVTGYTHNNTDENDHAPFNPSPSSYSSEGNNSDSHVL